MSTHPLAPAIQNVRPASELKDLAHRANQAHQKAIASKVDFLRYARESGTNLILARNRMERGQWLIWLKENFTASRQTAWRYIRAAEEWETVEGMTANGDEASVQNAINYVETDGDFEKNSNTCAVSGFVTPCYIGNGQRGEPSADQSLSDTVVDTGVTSNFSCQDNVYHDDDVSSKTVETSSDDLSEVEEEKSKNGKRASRGTNRSSPSRNGSADKVADVSPSAQGAPNVVPTPQPEVIKDALEGIVPDHLSEIFSQGDEFRQIINDLNGIGRRLKALADKPAGTLLRLQAAEISLKELKRIIRFDRPYCVCRVCEADSRRCRENCPCRGTGWLNETRYEVLVKEYKQS